MKPIDWIVLAATLLSITLYGLWKGRGGATVRGFLLADRSMRWYTVALAIMATQASAITFTSTPGQAFADGMRFVQFYFGLPIAMVILSITAVPIYHRLGVYTAYEYLERRFDPKMRVLGTLLFLVSRGLSAGMTIYAPALVLSVTLGLDIGITSLIIGGVVVLYTTTGGVRAVNHTDVLQFLVIMAGMLLAFLLAIRSLPGGMGLTDALALAGASGKLKPLELGFDPSSRYNLWTGLIGGMFVALAYFGTDQSQVQRYLTGRSVAESRLALLFNGMVKIPMQFFILLLGVMVFVFFLLYPSPLVFNPIAEGRVLGGPLSQEYRVLQQKHAETESRQRDAAAAFVEARKSGDPAAEGAARAELGRSRAAVDSVRTHALETVRTTDPDLAGGDVNYVFLSFVLRYLPAGVVGLLFACIFAASMSSSSGELSALATISVVDIYRRFLNTGGSERHYLAVSRVSMAFWGIYGIFFAQFAGRLGSLIEAVNILGSLFYGTMLGIFLLAFYVRSVGGTAAFVGALAGEAVVVWCFVFTEIAWLWYNVIGCVVVIAVAAAITIATRTSRDRPDTFRHGDT